MVWCLGPTLLLAGALGCGSGNPPTYPVQGKVVFADGKPLTTGGIVLTESITGEHVHINARGAIDANGEFRLTTFNDDDGAVAGQHRVMVRAKRDSDDYIKRGIIPRPVIDPRFENYETSGLEFTVQQGKNEFTLEVQLPGP